jgi:hypothetical protein
MLTRNLFPAHAIEGRDVELGLGCPPNQSNYAARMLEYTCSNTRIYTPEYLNIPINKEYIPSRQPVIGVKIASKNFADKKEPSRLPLLDLSFPIGIIIGHCQKRTENEYSLYIQIHTRAEP